MEGESHGDAADGTEAGAVAPTDPAPETSPDASGSAGSAPPWQAPLCFLIAAGLAGAFHIHAGFVNDDALITLRCSENLVAGKGLVYNPGEAVLGTTSPLWALLLAGAVAVGGAMPAASSWLGVLAFGWTGVMTAAILRGRGLAPRARVVGVALVASSPVLLRWAGSGMETSLAVALLATFLWCYESGRMGLLGPVCGAMVLTRPDAGLFVAAGAVLEILRTRSARGLLRPLAGFGVVVAPWLVVAGLYYGSPLPNSGFAKSLQEADWGPYLAGLGRALWAVGPVLPFALLGLVRTAGIERRALAAWCLLAVVAAMHLAGFPGCGWYLPLPMFLLLLLAVEGGWAVACAVRRGPVPLPPLAVAAALLLGHLPVLEEVRAAKRDQAMTERLHGAVGDWLRENAPPDAAVGVDNIGYIGYRSGLRVIDMLGLVQAETVAHIAEQQARGETMDWALRHHRPEFVAIWVGRGNTWKYRPDWEWFDSEGYRAVFSAPLREDRETPAYTVFSRVPLPGQEGGK